MNIELADLRAEVTPGRVQINRLTLAPVIRIWSPALGLPVGGSGQGMSSGVTNRITIGLSAGPHLTHLWGGGKHAAPAYTNHRFQETQWGAHMAGLLAVRLTPRLSLIGKLTLRWTPTRVRLFSQGRPSLSTAMYSAAVGLGISWAPRAPGRPGSPKARPFAWSPAVRRTSGFTHSRR